jgi:general secretion pathway protein A
MSGDPCLAVATQHQLQCHKATKLTLPQLRQLDRPGILTLQSGHGPVVYAVLVGLSEQTATLQIGTTQQVVSTLSLGQLWQGDFATYWKPPLGYTPGLNDGSAGPAVAALAQHLAGVDGLAAPDAAASNPVLNAALKARVRAFQRAQGLDPDGLPGPLTFMQIERARGLTEPRLNSGAN